MSDGWSIAEGWSWWSERSTLGNHPRPLGLGVIRRIESKRAGTPIASLEKVRFLQVSSLRVGSNWEEIPPLRL